MCILQIVPDGAFSKLIESGVLGALLLIVISVLIWVMIEHQKERKRYDDIGTAKEIRHENIVQENIKIIQDITNKNADAYNRNTEVLNEIKGILKSR